MSVKDAIIIQNILPASDTNEIRLEKRGVYFVILEHLKLNLIKVHLMELDTEPLL